MGPEKQLTMVRRMYIMREIYNSTRRLLLLVNMSCAVLDKMWQRERIRDRMGETEDRKQERKDKKKYILELLKDIHKDQKPYEPAGT